MSAADLEARILAGLADAQEAYEEFVATEGWLERGYDSFGEWWSSTVVPTMRALSMRPTREIAARVDEQLRVDNESLPPAQRYTQRDRAELTGLSRETIQDRDKAERTPTPDLEDPLPPEIADQIQERIATRQQSEAFARAESELDAAMEGTTSRFRANFSSAMRKAGEVCSFDAQRVAECYATDYDASIERAFFASLERFIDEVREARRRDTSGLRVVRGGRAS